MPDTKTTPEPRQNLAESDHAPQTSASPRYRALAAGWRQNVAGGHPGWVTATGKAVCWESHAIAPLWYVERGASEGESFVRDEDAALTAVLALEGVP